jgi:hypothetical protein
MELQLIASININTSVFHLPLNKGAHGTPLSQFGRKGQLCAYVKDKTDVYNIVGSLEWAIRFGS